MIVSLIDDSRLSTIRLYKIVALSQALIIKNATRRTVVGVIFFLVFFSAKSVSNRTPIPEQIAHFRGGSPNQVFYACILEEIRGLQFNVGKSR